MARPNLGKLVASKIQKSLPDVRSSMQTAARTRFAPSPTGLIHLGSLRTALYNYLLARATKGQFILRLEDTDRTRLKPGAEENIYKSLQWANIQWDEGPFKQSERGEHYARNAKKLLEEGKAYRCFCSKDRLDKLAQSARELWPPSTASYDRKCEHVSKEESDKRASAGESHVVRFKAPEKWPIFTDLLHGEVDVQTQINPNDRRYDDFVILKSDGMPTYHFANVVDDTLMRITHVIRGEEWLPSTPKHIALYNALVQKPPFFVHIPLLTGEGGKKLSKRRADQGVWELSGPPDFISPEALDNFVALLGWSPISGHSHNQGESINEVMSLGQMESEFTLEGLTMGNIQVDFGKLQYLNRRHFESLLETNFEEAARRCQAAFPQLMLPETEAALSVLRRHVSSIGDYVSRMTTLLAEPTYAESPKDTQTLESILRAAITFIEARRDPWAPQELMSTLTKSHSKKDANMFMRYALLDGRPGTSVIEALSILGPQASLDRLQRCASNCMQDV